MNEAADRYSPEIAEAFQPTDTERPATKKSLAVFEVRAERNPIQSVAKTVINENPKIQGSIPPSSPPRRGNKKSKIHGSVPLPVVLHLPDLILFQPDGTADKNPRDGPDRREEQ